MAHVGADHEEVVVAHRRDTSLLGSTVDGHVLAEDVVIADYDRARSLLLKGKILRIPSDNRPVADRVAAPHPDMTCNHGAGLDPASLADHGTRFDDGIRTNLDIRSEGGCRVDKCRGMNQRHF